MDPMNPTNPESRPIDGEVKTIDVQDLLGEVTRLKIDGYRLVTLTGVRSGTDRVEILYHFDRDLGLTHLRLCVPATAPVPSISPVFMSAFLAENEIQDLFHVRFHGLVIDYQGRLLLSKGMTAHPPGREDAPQTHNPTAGDEPARP